MKARENLDSLDQILLEQDTLLPSSGFAAAVMDAVRQEAATPPPIPFPWKWALPGIAALVVSLAALFRLLAGMVSTIGGNPAGSTEWINWLNSRAAEAVVLRTEAAPAVLAIAASWVCIALCRKLAGNGPAR
jgi:hypothetical protein